MIQLYASNFPVPVILINVLTSRLNMIREAWPTGCPTYPHCQFSCNAHLKPPGQLSQLHIDEDFPVKGFFKPIKLQAVDLLVSAQSVDGASVFHQIEARYPALLFKQQLVDQIEKVYGVISDKMKEELNPLLELCIQVPHFLSKGTIH